MVSRRARVDRSSARVSIATTPCPTAGKNSSTGKMLLAASTSPSRLRPASASSVASTAPSFSLRRRVSTLPRIGTTSISLRNRFTRACRRSEAVPTTAPGASSCRNLAERPMKTSRGSSRGKTAVRTKPSGSTVGTSLAECTAKSIVRRSSASSISLVNRPLPPASASVRSWITSPVVRMMVSGKCSTSRPRAAASCACTILAWASASGLPRVPIRVTAVVWAACTILLPCRSGAHEGRGRAACGLDPRYPFHKKKASPVKPGNAPKPGKGFNRIAPMVVLGIETTCDETAAAVVERPESGPGRILSNVVLSQIKEHAAFGGVVPEIAARAHVEALDLIIAQAMAAAGQIPETLDGVAAAAGPGLIGGVIVGLTTAKAIALVAERPLIAVNHLEAHALTARLTNGTPFPYCLFLASGGHTQVVAVRGVGEYERLGTTVDDAIGEAFDKTAKLFGLPYPGGPQVEKEALSGNPARFALPRPMLGKLNADFSLSGLKTAVRIEAERIAPVSEQDVRDLCASFQQAIVDVITDRLRCGLKMFNARLGAPTALVEADGVAANEAIRKALSRIAAEIGTTLVVPPAELCTDNGAMIAWAGAERLALGLRDTLDTAPRARWPLAEVRGPDPFGVSAARTAPLPGTTAPA